MKSVPRNRKRKRRLSSRLGVTAASILLLAVPSPAMGFAGGQAEAPAVSRWYLAEGYTGAGFQGYLCIANQDRAQAEVTVSFLFNGARPLELPVSVPAQSRHTVDVNRAVGPGKEVSVVVSSATAGLAVERSSYFACDGRLNGSHVAQAATRASRDWYFAEGYTGPGFDEYICVLNPTDDAASLEFNFLAACGDETAGGMSVPARSRRTFKVNDLAGRGKDVSTWLRSDRPVVAERTMYFHYGPGGESWSGGHCAAGATSLSAEYFFAEGTTRPGFDQWLTVQNPNDEATTLSATYQFGPGQGAPVTREYTVEARRRRTLFVPAEVGRGRDVSVRLRATAPFLAERSLYFGFERPGLAFEGGHCAIGAAGPAGQWFLAEGYTGPSFEQWLCIQNVSGSEATIQVEYYTQEAGPLPARTVKVPGNCRATVLVNAHAGPDLQLATRLTSVSGPDIVVERPIYFDHGLGLPGGAVAGVLHGVCFSPYLTVDPLNGGWVTVDEVARLMDVVAPYARWIRTFCSQGEWDAMPGLARERGLYFAAGCDIHRDLGRNRKEIVSLIAQVGRGEVDLACVGDEVLQAKALSEDQLIGYMRQVKATGVPTTTSEAWNVLLAHPRIIAECDVVTVNIFPYWEGVAVEKAVAYLEQRYREVREAAPGKRVIVETGWPSAGQAVGKAVAGPENAAGYLAEFMRWAYEHGVEYFYFEAFDELWKECREGPCGANWGLWTVESRLKPQVAEVISPRR